MTTLQAIRRSGGDVRLEGTGLALSGVPKSIVPGVTAAKAQLISALRREAMVGVTYPDSHLYWQLEAMFLIVKRLVARGVSSKECETLIAVLKAVDDAAYESMATAKTLLVSLGAETMKLVRTIALKCGEPVLEGKDLAAFAAKVFDQPTSTPQPNPPKATLNRAAFAPPPQGALI